MSRTTYPQQAATGFRQVDPVIVEAMKEVIIGQTDESLTAQFGLSYNTWRKIRSGLPVRCSLAERVEARIRKGPKGSLITPSAANSNEAPKGGECVTDQVRFERCVARELAGDVDF